MTNPSGWTGGSGATIKYLSDDEVRRFFETVEKTEDPLTRARDLCLFHLMLSFGLRCLEAKLLRVDNVNLKTVPAMIYVVRVKKKCVKTVNGEKVRMEKRRDGDWYRLSESDEARVKAWLKARKGLVHAEASESLFLTRQALTISTNQINCLTHKYGKKAGMPDIYPHQFRHTCGIRLARKGRNSFAIQKRLGHVSVLSTEVYVQIAGPDRAEEDRKDNAAIEGDEDDL